MSNAAMWANGHQVAVLLLSKSSPHVGQRFSFSPSRAPSICYFLNMTTTRVCFFLLRLLHLALNETKQSSNASRFIVWCVLAAARLWPRSGSAPQNLTPKLNYRGNNCSAAKIARLCVLTWLHWAELYRNGMVLPTMPGVMYFSSLSRTQAGNFPFSLFFFVKKPQRNVLWEHHRVHICSRPCVRACVPSKLNRTLRYTTNPVMTLLELEWLQGFRALQLLMVI